MNKNETYRLFSIIAYDDSETLNFHKIYSSILTNKFTYFYIYHKSEDNNKKPHYHICIYLPSARSLTYIKNKLNLNDSYIKVFDEFGKRYTLKKTLGYFLHYNNKEKINYNINDIKTNNEDLVLKYYYILCGGNNMSNELKEIIAFIEDNQPTIKNLLKFCIENNYLDTFRKFHYILNIMVQNERI